MARDPKDPLDDTVFSWFVAAGTGFGVAMLCFLVAFPDLLEPGNPRPALLGVAVFGSVGLLSAVLGVIAWIRQR